MADKTPVIELRPTPAGRLVVTRVHRSGFRSTYEVEGIHEIPTALHEAGEIRLYRPTGTLMRTYRPTEEPHWFSLLDIDLGALRHG